MNPQLSQEIVILIQNAVTQAVYAYLSGKPMEQVTQQPPVQQYPQFYPYLPTGPYMAPYGYPQSPIQQPVYQSPVIPPQPVVAPQVQQPAVAQTATPAPTADPSGGMNNILSAIVGGLNGSKSPNGQVDGQQILSSLISTLAASKGL